MSVLLAAELVFRADGTPYSPLHDDVYHSPAGALAQTRHVFLKGNGLPDAWRLKPAFTVLETGFGMGINFLATWAAWRSDIERSAALEFVSIEKYPFSADDLRRAHAAVIDDPYVMPLALQLADAWPPLVPGIHRLSFDSDAVGLTLIFGDIADALASLRAQAFIADSLYLDGFAPARNPDMWTPSVMASLAALSSNETTFATYTSAGSVKRALRENGFEFRKVAGFSGKWAMLTGKRATSPIETNCVID
ncbi:tRNA (5-methylaminomethyl-2-thiouridylate)-methyltransferase / FAD-dependent U34 oxidoreductase [Candidatus Burkholderia verschuerenii]|uniref:tRNA (5-methylaminomethyl-2-thiouridylate)-methyltransferase / FAD-dependent U34 oxidoreductase n=2 Tax=Candidatus Burkholderia verschuerenii TaxID=242163 RepID=A0A0L0LW53_9BURK|nr:tRNA (5-methylaminomethyl-2-thiouridylate)-methyltransferase / FAD-dependent U34 oxidoreductase [Candidatus Burkholderia verschuerenii]